jgi:hypothetical protein
MDEHSHLPEQEYEDRGGRHHPSEYEVARSRPTALSYRGGGRKNGPPPGSCSVVLPGPELLALRARQVSVVNLSCQILGSDSRTALSSTREIRNRHRKASPGVLPLGGLQPGEKGGAGFDCEKGDHHKKRDRPQSAAPTRLFGQAFAACPFAANPHRVSSFPHNGHAVRPTLCLKRLDRCNTIEWRTIHVDRIGDGSVSLLNQSCRYPQAIAR